MTDLSPRAYRLGLGAVLLLAAAGGLARLAVPPIWLDEASSWHNVSGTWAHLWQRAIQGEDSGGLLYAALLKPWTTLAGTGEVALRLPGVVLWLATIAVLARAARLAWNRRAAVLSAAAALAHPSLLAAARQARSYALLLFLAALALLALAEAGAGRRRRGAWLLGAASLAAAATHVMGVFVAVGGACACLVIEGRRRGAWRRAALAVAPALAFALAWTGLIHDRVGRNLQSFWIPGTLVSNILSMAALLVAPLALAGAWILWRDPSPRARAVVAGCAAFALPVALGPALVSAFASSGTHLVQLRYALALAPLAAAAAGCALATLPWRLAASIAALAVAASLPYSASKQAYAPIARGGQDIRGAAAFLASRSRPGDTALVEPANDWMPLAYYGWRTTPLDGREGGWRRVTGNGTANADDAEARGAVWLVRFSRRTSAPPGVLEQATVAGRFGTVTILRATPR